MIGSVIFLVCGIFYFDMIIRKLDVAVILVTFAISIGKLNLFLYCYCGQCATDDYAAYADYLYESNWIKLSNDLQKKFILMIAYAQEPVYYHGYGMVYLNLKTFLAVCFHNFYRSL